MDSEFIALFSAVIVAAVSTGGQILLNRLNRKDSVSDGRAEQDNLIRKAVMCMLHDRIYQACRYYIQQGEVDEAGYTNVSEMYEAYHSMGGNGTGTRLFQEVENLYIKGGIPDERK